MMPRAYHFFVAVGTIAHEEHHGFSTPRIGAVLGVALVFRGNGGDFSETFSITPRTKSPVVIGAVSTTIAVGWKCGDFSELVSGVAAPRANRHKFGNGLFAFAAHIIEAKF